MVYTSPGIVAWIAYSRPAVAVSALVDPSMPADFGNIMDLSEAFRDSVDVRCGAALAHRFSSAGGAGGRRRSR
jgi:hypothetical protein